MKIILIVLYSFSQVNFTQEVVRGKWEKNQNYHLLVVII